MNGKEFIWAAELWMEQDECEAVCRSSVSRAYYGALHHCREFVEDCLKISAKQRLVDIHKGVPSILKCSEIDELVGIGLDLSFIREERNKADYTIGNPLHGARKKAETIVEIAKCIERSIDSAKAQLDLRLVQSKIRPHLKGLLMNWRITSSL